MRSNRSRKKNTRRNKNRRTYRRKSPKKRINRKRYSNKKRTGRRRINRKRRRMLRGGAPHKWVEPASGVGERAMGLQVRCAACGELERHVDHIHEFKAHDAWTGDDNCKDCAQSRDHFFHRHTFVPAHDTVDPLLSTCIKELGGPVRDGGVICGKNEADQCHQNLE